MKKIKPRVKIKLTSEQDFNNIQMLWNNGEVMKWVGFPEGLNIKIENLEKWLQNIKKRNGIESLVVFNEDIGFCGELFYEVELEHKRAGLDIKFLPSAQGKGLATEALNLLINYVFENEPEVEGVWTEPSIENTSARNLYSKCGLKSKERPKDMEPRDSYWELTRSEWEIKNKMRYEE